MKKVILFATLVVSSLVSAQNYSLGGVYGFGANYLEASKGIEVGIKNFGFVMSKGGFLTEDAFDIEGSVNKLMRGDIVVTGGEYTRIGVLLRNLQIEKNLKFKIGPVIDFEQFIGVLNNGVLYDKNDYRIKLLMGVDFDIPNSNVYFSIGGIFPSMMEDGDTSLLLGGGYRW